MGLLKSRLRWRRATPGEMETVAARLRSWPSEAGGHVRHMFALSTIESFGPDPIRLVSDDDVWAAAVVFPGRLVVPCGDAAAIARAGPPTRSWRLVVGDAPPVDALLAGTTGEPGLVVHHQRFMVADPARVPDVAVLPDPGLRLAVAADLGKLAELAVQLHVDDRFGPDPGRAGLRGYRQRLEETVRSGLVWCVGPVGAPVLKLERSVSSARFGVQLAGIVVDRRHRGEGLGRAAVATAVRAALQEVPRRPMTLHVRADNTAAQHAYLAAGFEDREEWRLAVRA